ncbi:preprotein translocase subunit SecG [Fulvivirga sp. RKSG066]|uniref:preprotein translocase subunit SecG n=1 Tax=Fulvivirga aurantia TaxID=2529383 RepID=UPI0012BC2671|nr:preprotein translocase subunit SecG [Fulvivirga aurantia]MTI19912.1 preprotein translocase subunit SecG [Fulvivirga aurantia]
MLNIILGLIVLVAVLLVLVILAQNSKGGGLSSQFGGAGASNMIGVKKTGDLLSNLTWGLVIALFVLTLSTNLITVQPQQGPTDEFIDRAQEQTTVPSLDLGADDAANQGVEEEGLENLEPADDQE